MKGRGIVQDRNGIVGPGSVGALEINNFMSNLFGNNDRSGEPVPNLKTRSEKGIGFQSLTK